jgi:hypothetical protein
VKLDDVTGEIGLVKYGEKILARNFSVLRMIFCKELGGQLVGRECRVKNLAVFLSWRAAGQLLLVPREAPR